MTVYSGEEGGILSVRAISLSAFSSTSAGICLALIFSVRVSRSATSSPSSLWMALSCSRRKYSFWFLSMFWRTAALIFFSSLAISSSSLRQRSNSLSRSTTPAVSRSFCLVSSLMCRYRSALPM